MIQLQLSGIPTPQTGAGSGGGVDVRGTGYAEGGHGCRTVRMIWE